MWPESYRAKIARETQKIVMEQMQEIKSYIYGLDDLVAVVDELRQLLERYRVLTLEGPLGSGKTTLVQELLRAAGVTDTVTSPTFTYLNSYEDGRGRTFYHFDLYRMGTLDEFLSAGFGECLEVGNGFVLIEWPAIVMPLLQNGVCHAVLEYHPEPDKRILRISCVERTSDVHRLY